MNSENEKLNWDYYSIARKVQNQPKERKEIIGKGRKDPVTFGKIFKSAIEAILVLGVIIGGPALAEYLGDQAVAGDNSKNIEESIDKKIFDGDQYYDYINNLSDGDETDIDESIDRDRSR